MCTSVGSYQYIATSTVQGRHCVGHLHKLGSSGGRSRGLERAAAIGLHCCAAVATLVNLKLSASATVMLLGKKKK